jgi:hypothetical protein
VAELRSVLGPVFNDIQSLSEGQGDGQTQPKTLLADLLRLKKLNVHQLLGLLEEAQQALAEAKQVATAGNQTEEVAELEKISTLLTSATTTIGGLAQKFDDAVLPLRNKLDQVELWFDTVTQSFDERYARHMRTVSICISIVLVILLNANFFRVYKNISSNEVQRDLIAESAPAVLGLAQKVQSTPTPTPTPSPSPGANPSARQSSSPNPTPTPTPAGSPVDVKAEIDETRQNIAVLTGTYEGFGFTPLTWQQTFFYWKGLVAGETPLRDNNGVLLNGAGEKIFPDCVEATDQATNAGKCAPVMRPQSHEEWRASRRADLFTIFGWAIMVMLLSVGAPFWQDTLESLFGIKNLLRQKSGTQNIETASGSGQPKQA